MQFEERSANQAGETYRTTIPYVDPAHAVAIASIRTTLLVTIILGTFFPFAAFICGIVLLVKSSVPSKAQGWVAATGVFSLFWMPIITAIFGFIALAKLDKSY